MCAARATGDYTLEHMAPDSAEAKDLIESLVKHHVAITSTLPVFESDGIPGRPPLRQEAMDALLPESREAYLYRRNRTAEKERRSATARDAGVQA